MFSFLGYDITNISWQPTTNNFRPNPAGIFLLVKLVAVWWQFFFGWIFYFGGRLVFFGKTGLSYAYCYFAFADLFVPISICETKSAQKTLWRQHKRKYIGLRWIYYEQLLFTMIPIGNVPLPRLRYKGTFSSTASRWATPKQCHGGGEAACPSSVLSFLGRRSAAALDTFCSWDVREMTTLGW